VGDFNLIRFPENRNKAGGNSNEMMLFNDLIHHLDLIGILFQGIDFTWNNIPDNTLLEKLDWVFTSTSWSLSCPNTKVLPLYHIPYIIQIDTLVPKSNVFRFENYWVDFRGFQEIVKMHWDSNPFHSNSARTISGKFK
jgi:hypothetical protein